LKTPQADYLRDLNAGRRLRVSEQSSGLSANCQKTEAGLEVETESGAQEEVVTIEVGVEVREKNLGCTYSKACVDLVNLGVDSVRFLLLHIFNASFLFL
jgi:hypothetical protein